MPNPQCPPPRRLSTVSELSKRSGSLAAGQAQLPRGLQATADMFQRRRCGSGLSSRVEVLQCHREFDCHGLPQRVDPAARLRAEAVVSTFSRRCRREPYGWAAAYRRLLDASARAFNFPYMFSHKQRSAARRSPARVQSARPGRPPAAGPLPVGQITPSEVLFV
jgi:hypothetical protein